MTNNTKPCALLINDVHVSKDNILEFNKNLDEALSVCKSNGIRTLVIGGDLWQSRSSQTLNTLLAVRNALIEAHNNNIEVVIAEGNHCKVDQESILGYGHVFDQYPGIRVVDTFTALKFGKVNLYVMSYFPESGSFQNKLNELLNSIIFSDNNVYILYIHEGINGALSVSSDDELPAKIFQDFDKVLVGHYHNRCVIKNTNIEYIGSSRQHNFGEDEEKGYTILYEDGNTEFIKNEVNIRYKVIEINAKKINDDLIDRLAIIKEDTRYRIKTKINCTGVDAKKIDRNKLIEAGVSKVEIFADEVLTDQCRSASLETKFDKAGIKKEYTSFCNQKEVADVNLGLKYLDKIC